MTNPLIAVLPKIIGHRGAASHAPENTLAGFTMAHRLGVSWVEIDVRLTGDGRLILLHDDTVERTTDGVGRASDLPLDVIASFDAGRWFRPDFCDVTVPTVEEAIDLALTLGLGINFEIKPHAGSEVETATALVTLLDAAWPATAPPPLLSSFAIACLTTAKERAPHLARGLLVAAPLADWRDLVRQTGAASLHCRHDFLNQALIKTIREQDLAVLCYTVNDTDRARHLFQWGITSIITDDPPALMKVY